jgi:hypothetical protein
MVVPTNYIASDFVSGSVRLFGRIDQEVELLARCMRLLLAGKEIEANDLYDSLLACEKS